MPMTLDDLIDEAGMCVSKLRDMRRGRESHDEASTVVQRLFSVANRMTAMVERNVEHEQGAVDPTCDMCRQ